MKLTAIVVAKRHHIRFFPTEKGNCRPGTLVDRCVTSPFFQDFYLQSHHAIQGTAKPAHYFVLENGKGQTEQQLQAFVCFVLLSPTLWTVLRFIADLSNLFHLCACHDECLLCLTSILCGSPLRTRTVSSQTL